MAELDYQYVSKLVSRARSGESLAYSELFAATYQRQYQFSLAYPRNSSLAESALKQTFITAFKSLDTLRDPRLFVSWAGQINMRICYRLHGPEDRGNSLLIGGVYYPLGQIMALPFSESQVVFLRCARNLPVLKIANILEISPVSVRRHLSAGKRRLRGVSF